MKNKASINCDVFGRTEVEARTLFDSTLDRGTYSLRLIRGVWVASFRVKAHYRPSDSPTAPGFLAIKRDGTFTNTDYRKLHIEEALAS